MTLAAGAGGHRQGPLDGVRVVDAGTRISAPFCAGLLGEPGKKTRFGRGIFFHGAVVIQMVAGQIRVEGDPGAVR